MSRAYTLAAITLTIAALLAGCAPKTGPARFYRLEPEAAPQAATEPARSSRVIGLGPVRIPGYLDRPQIVTGAPGNRLILDEYHRWAEPLRDTLSRVLSENLAALLPGDHLVTFPWNRALTPEYQVEIDLARFHVNANGVAELWANWNVLKNNRAVLLSKSRIAESAAGQDIDAQVAAQNRALARLSREIAQALSELPVD